MIYPQYIPVGVVSYPQIHLPAVTEVQCQEQTSFFNLPQISLIYKQS